MTLTVDAPAPSQGTAPLLLVTGGSRGIGAATCVLAARAGWDVVVNYVREEAAAQSVAEAVRTAGRRAWVMQADMADEAQVVGLFRRMDQEAGRVQGLVNNAGVVDRAARVDEMSVDRLQRMWAINLTGPFVCAREAVKRMSTRHGGTGGVIVNLSSVAARLGGPGQYVDYAASKAGIDILTVGLAKEVAAEGIRVNAVRPGVIDTDIHASGGQPDRAQRIAPTIPVQRPGTAEEVAQCIVWLLSPQAAYATGALFDITGGR